MSLDLIGPAACGAIVGFAWLGVLLIAAGAVRFVLTVAELWRIGARERTRARAQEVRR